MKYTLNMTRIRLRMTNFLSGKTLVLLLLPRGLWLVHTVSLLHNCIYIRSRRFRAHGPHPALWASPSGLQYVSHKHKWISIYAVHAIQPCWFYFEKPDIFIIYVRTSVRTCVPAFLNSDRWCEPATAGALKILTRIKVMKSWFQMLHLQQDMD